MDQPRGRKKRTYTTNNIIYYYNIIMLYVIVVSDVFDVVVIVLCRVDPKTGDLHSRIVTRVNHTYFIIRVSSATG